MADVSESVVVGQKIDNISLDECKGIKKCFGENLRQYLCIVMPICYERWCHQYSEAGQSSQKTAFGSKQYSPKMIIVTPNAIQEELFGK